MKRIDLTITALSPLAIGRQKHGSVSEAETYIPGTVTRGAIATQILKHADREFDDLSENGGDFKALFLGDNPAIFQNAYPAIAKINEESQYVSDRIAVLPATAVSSKAKSGFKPEGNGVFDTLIDRFCAEKYNHPYDPNCPEDKGRVEPYSSFYSTTKEKEKTQYRSHSVTTRFLTRVGINRRRATAEDEILYSIEVLNESFVRNPKVKHPKWEYVAYRSAIWVDDSLADKLTAYINQNSESFRIGGSVSRGLGKVKIKAELTEIKNNLQSRITAFNESLKKRWGLWKIFGEPAEGGLGDRTYFTINLQSDGIFSENWLRTTVISEAMLQNYAGITDNSLKLEVAYSSYDYRSGWNAAWGLMKDTELVTNRGAVYLFSVDTTHESQWVDALAKLEEQGVGDRTCEGFGQVRVCDEFHTIFREKAV